MAAPAVAAAKAGVSGPGVSSSSSSLLPPPASSSSSSSSASASCPPELDFRSGARVEELNRLIQEFTRHDQRDYDDQRALEIHTAKDFIFSMLVKHSP